MAKEEQIAHGEVEYMGGHKAYPKPGIKRIFFYSDRIEIEILAKQGKQEKTTLNIPYSRIINIENMDENAISGMRVAMLGIMGALLKKKHIYTIIFIIKIRYLMMNRK